MTQTYQTWCIEPIDPLIFGDGRPFTGTPGARLQSLPLPPPSTLAGITRSRAGMDAEGRFSWTPEQARQVEVHGPILVDQAGTPLLPAPADALLLAPEQGAAAVSPHRLVPLLLPSGARSWPQHCPVHLAEEVLGKPWGRAPAFWPWDAVRAWLVSAGPAAPAVELPVEHDLDLPSEPRTHVTINRETGTADEGALFMTQGRRFDLGPGRPRYAIGLRTTATTLREGAGQLGGERRFGRWVQVDFLAPMAEPPPEVVVSAREGALRLLLATPAWLDAGHDPGPALGPQARVVAQVSGRPQANSGWDLANNRSKPPRRLVPAGAVCFLSLDGSPDQREEWLRSRWLRPISDRPAACQDGFGLALFGAWDGALHPLPA